ncbi:hypothetical protein RFI_03554 [Reticulomyxa filosa]|uniref:Uncharacterized protein n=1 Tax=Reticulomyxa filosa TaxID=46433 RepID=X6P7D2_RETFI|nr:hypothetical protein RFI_03554 [Reticulomyxa filosa]|eukprot:ETO33547.1 hypothetical protein RFI_03554 [Reticulomyxa filosa]
MREVFLFIYFNNDIAVHIRCGDILFGHGDYHFMTLNYYLFCFDQILNQSKHDVQLQRPLSVHFLSQLSSAGAHTSADSEHVDKCSRLVHALVFKLGERYNSSDAKNKSKLQFFIKNDDIVTDFASMMYAPHLICGTSTFCLHAALSNTHHKNVFVPDIGPWLYLNSHTRKITQNGVLPPTHHLVDVRKNNWFLRSTEVAAKRWNTDENFEQLIQPFLEILSSIYDSVCVYYEITNSSNKSMK